MKKILLPALLLLLSIAAQAQIVNIPDPNFKNALVNSLCVVDIIWGNPASDVDTNNDGEIQVSEAAAVEWLVISNQNITSLTGIESFTNMFRLDCSNNQLTTLSITQNPILADLNCSHNQLTSLTFDLDTSNLFYDPVLNCSYNMLTSIVIPTGFYYSISLNYNQFSQLSQINMAGAYIESLGLSGNPFSTIDTSQLNGFVSGVGIVNCPITTAIVRTESAYISGNPQLASLLLGSGGQYTVQNNPVLQYIDIKDGQYGFIDGDFPDPQFNVSNNPMLEFICLDDMGAWYYEGEYFFQWEIENLYGIPAGVNRTYYCDFTPGGGYNTINGTVHFDCGGSNALLSNEDVKINLDKDNNGSVDGMTNPNNSGNFWFYASGGGTIKPVFEHNYFTVSPANFVYSFSDTGETQDVDFCVSPNGVHPDLEVAIVPILPARPGFDAIYKIVYTNKGTQTQSGSVTLAFEDDMTDFVSATMPVDSQSTGSLSWNFSGLSPFESREITFTLNVNSPLETPAVNIDDVLDFTASLATAETDETPSDNTTTLAQAVVGSFDPNDKAVSRFSIAPTALDQYLYYTVRFQNMGTYYAENIVIRDMLSNKLDLSTFEVVATSHPCRSVLTRGNNNFEGDKLEFFFEGIELPAAQDNEPGSHGLVTYKVKPKNTLVLNDLITNKAEIYFDYNSAIVTNTVTTTVTALGIGETDVENLSLYPNPVKNNLTISMHNNASVSRISIYNTLGQLVKTVQPDFNNYSMILDISALNTGTYFVQFVTNNGTTTKKLIKL